MDIPVAKNWHFDIDYHLKPYIPRNLVHRLPRPVPHFLGCRNGPRTEIGNILVAGWALVGAFVGLVVVEAVFMVPVIKQHGVPLLIASFVRPVLRVLVVRVQLTSKGCCSDTGIQYYRVTACPAAEYYNRSYHISCRRRWHYQALQAQSRF